MHRRCVFGTMQYFFVRKELQWTELVGMCTAGTLLTMEVHSGFKAHIKQVITHATFTVPFIHMFSL
jgi:hypothetical protein